MTTSATRSAPGATRAASPALTALRVLALLSVLSLAFQFVTAGRVLMGGSVELHGGGAIVLHVLTGLTAVAAIWQRRRDGGPVWPSALAVVVFGLTFAQAATGHDESLWVHVPGALVLTVGSVWLAAWAFAHRRTA